MEDAVDGRSSARLAKHPCLGELHPALRTSIWEATGCCATAAAQLQRLSRTSWLCVCWPLLYQPFAQRSFPRTRIYTRSRSFFFSHAAQLVLNAKLHSQAIAQQWHRGFQTDRNVMLTLAAYIASVESRFYSIFFFLLPSWTQRPQRT